MLGVMRATAGGFLVGLCAGVAIVLGLLAGQTSVGLGVTGATPTPAARADPTATPRPTTHPRVTDVFLVLRRETPTESGGDAWDEALFVRGDVAKPIPLPANTDRTVAPVTDGERVYMYVRGNRERGVGSRGRRLAAFTLDGREDETISDSTDLVQPSGLFVSPTGSTVAFFLDNRGTQATELWTYDTVARTKHVLVENIRRGALTGPVFAPNGTLFLRAGVQLFRASPKRSRADVVPVALEASVRWDAGIALSPDGGRLALVVQTPKEDEAESRLRIYSFGTAAPTTRFSGTGRLEIIAWLGAEEILVRHDNKALLLRGEAPQITRLDVEPASVRMGGDHRALASLAQVGGQTQIVTVDLSTGARHAVPLPPPLPEASAARYALVQYLRVASSPGTSAETGLDAARPEAVLHLVSEQIRAIADAPPSEPVTAERVWFTSTPRTVYVDYRVGTTLWRRLVRVPATRNTESVVTVLGVFAPADGSWVLARGIDLADSAPVALFEFEPSVAQWITKPLVHGAAP